MQQELHFFPKAGDRPVAVSPLAQGNQIFLPQYNETFSIPHPEAYVQFSDLNIIICNEETNELELNLIISPYGQKKTLPPSLSGWIRIQGKDLGKVSWLPHPNFKMREYEPYIYGFEASNFQGEMQNSLTVTIQYETQANKSREPVCIEAGIKDIYHVSCKTYLYPRSFQPSHFSLPGDFFKSEIRKKLTPGKIFEKQVEYLTQAKVCFPGIRGKYFIEQKLSEQGNASYVYLVRNKEGKQFVAKILKLEIDIPLDKDGSSILRNEKEIEMERLDNIQRFNQEGYILKTMDHPCIIKAYEHFTVGDFRVLILEYFDNFITLEKWIQNNQPQYEQKNIDQAFLSPLLHYFFDIAQALEYLHLYNILHRDIKPENILICPDEQRAIILDLGVAKTEVNRDLSGFFTLGTPLFTAPEYNGIIPSKAKNYTRRSEVYSVGLLLYLSLTGRHPLMPDKPLYQMPGIERSHALVQNLKEDYAVPAVTEYVSLPGEMVEDFIQLLKEMLTYDDHYRVLSMENVERRLFKIWQKMEAQDSQLDDFFTGKKKLQGPHRSQVRCFEALDTFYPNAEHNSYLVGEEEKVVRYVWKGTSFINKSEEYFARNKKQYDTILKLSSSSVAKIVLPYFSLSHSYTIMEKVYGEKISTLVEEKFNSATPFSVENILHCMREVASILVSLDSIKIEEQFLLTSQEQGFWGKIFYRKGKIQKHSEQFFHRNIHPENILYNQEENKVYLTGFGEPSPEKAGRNILFSAPEVTDREGTVKADVFSLGVVFCLMLTNQHPFLDTEPFYPLQTDKLKRWCHQLQELGKSWRTPLAIEISDEVYGEVPDGCWGDIMALLSRMIAHNPEKRPHPKQVCQIIQVVLNQIIEEKKLQEDV